MWSHLVKAVILSIVLDSVPTQSATSGSAVVPTTVTITVTATVCSSNTFFTSYRSSTTSSCINPTVVTEGYTLTGFVEVTPTVQSTVSPTPTLMNYEVAPRVVIGHRITWIEIAQPIDQRASVENTCQFQCGGLCKSFFVYYYSPSGAAPAWRCETFNDHLTAIDLVQAELDISLGAVFDGPCPNRDPTLTVLNSRVGIAQMDYPS